MQNQSNCTQTLAHLAWKKAICHGNAAYITFQHKTTFSLRLKINRPIL